MDDLIMKELLGGRLGNYPWLDYKGFRHVRCAECDTLLKIPLGDVEEEGAFDLFIACGCGASIVDRVH
ncbi:MAG: hypothetical protein LDL33_06220 [Desulfomonile sp.]|nr:hypothetical protein [Desulfomonile sp.]